MPELPEIHLSEDLLELFVLDRLSGDEWMAVVEHLAACTLCRDRLEETEAYTTTIRQALENIAHGQP